jgi:hypothetical protein
VKEDKVFMLMSISICRFCASNSIAKDIGTVYFNQSKQQESLLDSKPQIIIKPPIHSNFRK